MKRMFLSVALVCAGALHATAGTFTFSVTDNPSVSGSFSVSGTISGRIFGLTDDGTNQSATSIIIDSAPAVYSALLGVDVVNTGGWSPQGFFTTSGGQITHSSFDSIHISPLPIFSFTLNTNYPGDNGGTSGILMNDGEVFRKTQDLNPTFGSASAETPEPATAGLVALVLVALAGWARLPRLARVPVKA